MWPCPSVSSLNWWSRKRWLEQQRSYKKWESWGKPPQWTCVFTDNSTYIYHICYGFYGLICLNMLDLIEQLSWNRTGSQQSSHFTCGTVEVCEILCTPGQWEGRCCAAHEATLVPGLAKMNGWNLKIIPSWKWRNIYLYIQITIFFWLWSQVCNETNPGCSGYKRDHTTQLYRDYNKPLQGSLSNNQDSMERIRSGFLGRGFPRLQGEEDLWVHTCSQGVKAPVTVNQNLEMLHVYIMICFRYLYNVNIIYSTW